MLTKDLQIHKDCMVLLHEVDIAVHNMRREYKYNIGQRMFNDTMDMRAMIAHANRTQGKERVNALNMLLEKNDNVDALVSFCLEWGYLPLKQVSEIVRRLDRVGRQATAWRNKEMEGMK